MLAPVAMQVPYLFTQFANVTARALGEQLGLKYISYIDDLLLAIGPHHPRIRTIVQETLSLVRSFGWIVNEAKCALQLSVRLQGLGFIIDSEAMCYEVPLAREEKMLAVAAEVVRCKGVCSARLVARLVGHVMSMHLALGLVCRLRSRYLLLSIRQAAVDGSWGATVYLSPRALEEVLFWIYDLHSLTPQPLRPHMLVPTFFAEADTSDSACAAIITRTPAGPCNVPVLRYLLPEEVSLGSALRELKGYLHTLMVIVREYQVAGHVVQLTVDALAACFIWQNGGSQVTDANGELALFEVVLDMYRLADSAKCKLLLHWRPRRFVVRADALSKVVDKHDFSLRPAALAEVVRQLGPWDCDRFAADHNTTHTHFNSRFASARSAGADAFAQDWSQGCSFALPSFNDVDRVLDTIERYNADAILVVPAWHARAWWRRLTLTMWPRVARWLELPPDSLVPNRPNEEDCFFVSSAHRSFDTPLLAVYFMPL
jgi:hypothetical protein